MIVMMNFLRVHVANLKLVRRTLKDVPRLVIFVEREGIIPAQTWIPNFARNLLNGNLTVRDQNFFRCKKTCGAVKCGYGVDDCFDELPESKCRKSNACDGAWKYGAANPNFAGCKKTCNLC